MPGFGRILPGRKMRPPPENGSKKHRKPKARRLKIRILRTAMTKTERTKTGMTKTGSTKPWRRDERHSFPQHYSRSENQRQ
jgi:hypothetical protein